MGDEKYAREYVKKIIDAKANGILFHIREKSFYKKYPKLELSENFYLSISKLLKKKKIKFGITLADPEKIGLCRKINVDFYKIFSRDILDTQIIEIIKSTKKSTFVSTGISDLREITKFMKIINNDKKRFTLIHTQLDNNIEKVNLRALPLLKEKYKIKVGYGNHAKNILTIYLSLAFEPSDLIFYVKGNKFKKHIDEIHAVKLEELKNIIKNINELSKGLGKKEKIKMKSKIK